MSQPQDTKTRTQAETGNLSLSPEIACHGSVRELVEHISHLSALYCEFGLDRDGSINLIGEEIADEAWRTTEELAGTEGFTIRDAFCFATIAKLNFTEGLRYLSSAPGLTEEPATSEQLKLADKLMTRALETLHKLAPDVPAVLRPHWLN